MGFRVLLLLGILVWCVSALEAHTLNNTMCYNNGTIPDHPNIPRAGAAVLQLEWYNPASVPLSTHPLASVFFVWALFDFDEGVIRIDVPNPALFIGNVTNPFPFLLSAFIQLNTV